MNASPAMDTGAPLLCSAPRSSCARGRHATVPIAELFTGPGRTSAKADELLVAVRVPALPARSGSAYVRLEYRRAMEIAVVGAAAGVTLNGDGDVETCRIAITASRRRSPRPGAEAAIVGSPSRRDGRRGRRRRAPTRRRSPTSAPRGYRGPASASWRAAPSGRRRARARRARPIPADRASARRALGG